MLSYETDRVEKRIERWQSPGWAASGFTLIEVMAAVTVFAVLMSVVLGSLTFLLSKTSSMKEAITIYEEARMCLDRISIDLKAVYVSVAPGYEEPGLGDDPDPYRFFCETDGVDDVQLEFTAFSHLPLGGGIPTRAGNITYYLKEIEGHGRVLMRRDMALKTDDSSERFSDIDDAGMDPVLCRHIKRLGIVCFDADGMEHESWDSDASNLSYATPSAVLISLEIEGGQADYQFETMINIPVFREKAADAL